MVDSRKKVAIIQSNYIPWKGYFDIINMVDEFIFLDEVQYTRRDWRNRNLIKTPRGLEWLTIPVQSKGNYTEPINNIKVAGSEWRMMHWNKIMVNYKKAEFFELYYDSFKQLYYKSDELFLSKINYAFIQLINKILGITTKLSWSTNYNSKGIKSQKLITLCKSAGAGIYLSGPSARNYLDEKAFVDDGITVEWMDYSGYIEYNQLYPPLEHSVTILDLLFNEGPKAKLFLKSFSI
jgi:hypothetical protein